MFLGAGSVMHAMDDDVDMRHYGALARALPITFVTFAAGYLAIIGFPFFSGFYSKDHIIEAAFTASPVAGTCAIIGAGVTAFYMTRLMLMTFDGRKRWREATKPAPLCHPHESPLVMTDPADHPGHRLRGQRPGPQRLDHRAGSTRRSQGEAETEGLLHVTRVGVVTMVVVLAGVATASRSSARAARSPTCSPPPARRSSGPGAATSTATRSTRPSSCARGSG